MNAQRCKAKIPTSTLAPGQPHLYLVLGTVKRYLRCYGREFDIKAFRRRFDTCECWSHQLSRVWKEVTGDSYIVHSVPVISARRAGAYLGKYMATDFEHRVAMEKLGFKRRWSTSAGWPGNGRLRLRQTVTPTTFFA